MKFDTIVLGAGIIGAAIAVHLQRSGRAVALLDRRASGLEASYGNAGLIQNEAVYPYAFPSGLPNLLRIAGNRNIDVHYHLAAMPSIAPFLLSYWRNSRPARYATIVRHHATLIQHCTAETRALLREANLGALLRQGGWIKLLRTPRVLEGELASSDLWRREYGVQSTFLDAQALRTAEPYLAPTLIGGILYADSDSVSDPGAVVQGYVRYFERLGGQFLNGDACTLEPVGASWRVMASRKPITGSSAVVALGAWSGALARGLGYELRMGIKRGYHMHYRPAGGAVLNRPVLDVEKGYALAPMARGIRLTTGAEFARLGAPATPVQLARAEPVARALFPCASRVDEQPWMGSRPCSPDMLPVIGPAPRHENLWFAFGHGHQGLTLAAVTGRLLGEMMNGQQPFIDPTPFRVDRPELR
jgi:D-amino-acid dehydrogenase